MAKGKQTKPEDIYNIMSLWAESENFAEVARAINMPLSTVRKIVNDNKDKPEFVELCEKKKKAFADKALTIMNKALKRLEEDIDDREIHIPANHLTTIIGTLYDKRALAMGQNTAKTVVEVKLPEGAKEYAE